MTRRRLRCIHFSHITAFLSNTPPDFYAWQMPPEDISPTFPSPFERPIRYPRWQTISPGCPRLIFIRNARCLT
jgi:hypothetical protein